MKKAHIFINYPNIVVLKDYLTVVKCALEDIGYNVDFINSFEGVSKEDLIVHPMGKDAFKYYLKGYHNYILWQQGATADESYMRHASKLRFNILNMIDVFAMKKAKAILYVSNELRNVYERRGHCSFKEKSYIMPCFNEQYVESVYSRKDYCKKTFAYAGSLAKWQCFEETVDLYKKIEDMVPNTFFKVLTFSVEEAKLILEKKGVKNYSVACVPKEKVFDELTDATFGFIIRQESVVNNVATPTKFSSYMSAGVIPVFSSCLKDFSLLSNNMVYAKKVDNLSDDEISKVIDFVNNSINPEEIKNEYYRIFDSYYNKLLHQKRLSLILKKLV